jgi:hypothetical protein
LIVVGAIVSVLLTAFIYGFLAPTLENPYRYEERTRCANNLASLGQSIRDFRAAQGRWPSDLGEILSPHVASMILDRPGVEVLRRCEDALRRVSRPPSLVTMSLGSWSLRCGLRVC